MDGKLESIYQDLLYSNQVLEMEIDSSRTRIINFNQHLENSFRNIEKYYEKKTIKEEPQLMNFVLINSPDLPTKNIINDSEIDENNYLNNVKNNIDFLMNSVVEYLDNAQNIINSNKRTMSEFLSVLKEIRQENQINKKLSLICGASILINIFLILDLFKK